MVTDFILALFLICARRKVCLLLSEEERIERFRKWWPFTGRPWRRGRRSWR